MNKFYSAYLARQGNNNAFSVPGEAGGMCHSAQPKLSPHQPSPLQNSDKLVKYSIFTLTLAENAVYSSLSTRLLLI
jgi:hypothetical protein